MTPPTTTQVFAVCESALGGELFGHLRTGEASWKEASFYGAQIASALDHVHLTKATAESSGCVLRSLAPECVWLDARGHVKLRDFDHLGFLDASGRAMTYFALLDYTAPEVMRRGPYGAPVDWWSLGVLLYEIIVGEPPFFGADAVDSFRLVLNAQPSWCTTVAMRRVRPGSGARQLVDDLLTKDPRHRLQGSPALHGRGLVPSDVPPHVPNLASDVDLSYFESYPSDDETDILPPRNPFSLHGPMAVAAAPEPKKPDVFDFW